MKRKIGFKGCFDLVDDQDRTETPSPPLPPPPGPVETVMDRSMSKEDTPTVGAMVSEIVLKVSEEDGLSKGFFDTRTDTVHSLVLDPGRDWSTVGE